MKVGEQVSVRIAGKTLKLDVEEFQPVEPSNYHWIAGWMCAIEIDGESVWYFIDEVGSVWDEANNEVGICPAQVVTYEKYAAE